MSEQQSALPGPAFSACRKDFTAAMQRAAAPVQMRNTIPVLANLLVEARHRFVCVTGTDMDCDVSYLFPAEIEREGMVTAPAQCLSRFAGALRGACAVRFAADDRVKLDVREYPDTLGLTLPSIEAVEFPCLAGPQKNEATMSVRLTAREWVAILDAVRPAISIEETRYYLNGVYLETERSLAPDKAVLRAVATDGHRMLVHEVAAEVGGPDTHLIVPRKTTALLRSRAASAPPDAVVEMHFGASETFNAPPVVRWIFKDGSIRSKVIDGTFPDYLKAVPNVRAKGRQSAPIDVRDWVREFERHLPLARAVLPDSKTLCAEVTLGPSGVSVRYRGPEKGELTFTLPRGRMPRAVSLGFNTNYLLSTLKTFRGAVRVSVLGPSDPVRFDEVKPDGALAKTGIIMPMKL